MNALGIFQNTVEAIIALFSVLGNSLVLYVVYKQKSLRTTTNYLITSLSSADFLVGAVGIPCVIINNFGIPKNFYGCLFMNCLIVCMTQISIFSLLTIALERCAAVLAPIKHRQYFHGKIVFVILGVVWVSACIVGCIPMFGWHLAKPAAGEDFTCGFVFVIDMHYMVYCNFFGFVLTPLCLMYITYLYIYRFITKSRKKIGKKESGPGPAVDKNQNGNGNGAQGQINTIQDKVEKIPEETARVVEGAEDPEGMHEGPLGGGEKNGPAPDVGSMNNSSGGKSTETQNSKSSQLNKESSATKRIFLVLVFFTICWLPVHIMNCISLFCGKTFFPLLMVGIFLSHANSALNPLLYALTNPKISAAFKTTLGISSNRVGPGKRSATGAS